MSMKKSYPYLPLIIAASVIGGIIVGTFYTKHFSANRLGIINASSNKINAILRIVDDQYVDSLAMDSIVEQALPNILSELDPHSIYIPAKDMQQVSSELESSFTGIGIAFTMQNDTILVNEVIPEGPAYKVGMLAGDRIVTVNDTLISKPGISTQTIMKKLKGPKGTKVRLGVKRPGIKELLDFELTRDAIPQKSIDAAYIVEDKKGDKFGYIKVAKFAVDTHQEMLTAIAKLKHEDARGFIIDLRDNTGGFMESAVRMINEFLPKDQLIVYAEGRKFPRLEERANGGGSCQKEPIVVLINEGSASASEIFSGAIQDNDRGTIIGRRSFGKGLVQQPINFNDGSGIRLTVARYYTPSGRCIQRPYEKGKDLQYEMDWINRYKNGEYFSKDSIKLDTLHRYYTANGRPVYAGGGIMPDIFVPQDTTGISSYLIEVLNKGLTIQFSLKYTDENRKTLMQYETADLLGKYLQRQGLVEKFIRYAEQKGVKRRNILINKSYRRLKENIIAGIIYNMLGKESFIEYQNKDDKTVEKAVEVLAKGESYPQAPQYKKSQNKE